MSRVEKLKNNKKVKKTIYYPILIGILSMAFLLFVVDYRINSVMGLKKIRIVDINIKNKTMLTLDTLGYGIVNVNLIYLLNDIANLKNNIKAIESDFQDSVREAIKQN